MTGRAIVCPFRGEAQFDTIRPALIKPAGVKELVTRGKVAPPSGYPSGIAWLARLAAHVTKPPASTCGDVPPPNPFPTPQGPDAHVAGATADPSRPLRRGVVRARRPTLMHATPRRET